MAIRPIDEYSGKVATPTTEYPDGKAQNITSPGDGTGTPWEAKLVNDIFGFQQFLTATAGITPSGTPDNATTSQYFEAIWKLLNVRPISVNVASDADITLTAAQNLYAKLTITDTGVILTTGRNVIVDGVGRIFIFTNSTAQTLTVKTAAGTGVAIPAGATATLLNDGTNVLLFITTKYSGTTITDGLDNNLFLNVKATSGYQKLPNGLIIQWGNNGSSGAGTTAITFPITFPSSCISVVSNNNSTTTDAVVITTATSKSTTGFDLNAFNNNGTRVAVTVGWIAIGY